MSHGTEWTDGRPVTPVKSLGQGSPLTGWLAIGPFPITDPPTFERDVTVGRALAVDSDPLGCETTMRPVLDQEHPNRQFAEGVSRWRKLSGAEEYNLKDIWPGDGAALAYAATYITAETETPLLLWADDWYVWRNSTVQIMLDGREVGHGTTPTLVYLTPGEHLLVLKIGGDGRSGSALAWMVKARAGVPEPSGDLLVGLVKPSGYWRGPEDAPKIEIDAAVINTGSAVADVTALSARLDGSDSGEEAKPVTIEPGEGVTLRMTAPLGDWTPGEEAGLTVKLKEMTIATTVVIPPAPPEGTIHILQGFHCDPVWVSDQHHYNLISLENVRMQADGCLADENYKAFVHELDYLRNFMDEYPEYRDEMFKLVKEGRMLVGSSYSEPNENNCSGEGIVRNILYGHLYHRRFLGGDPHVYHCWDVFGHVPQLSQILAKSGHDATLWSKSIAGFPPVFRHMALDGTLLTNIRTYYTWFSQSMDEFRQISEPVLREKNSYGLKHHMHVEASDFNPPCAWEVAATDEMADSLPKIVMNDPIDFLKAIDDDGSRIPWTSRNASQHHVGTQHTRVELKLSNRIGENRLVQGEMWSTFATLMGATYPDKAIDKAWRQLLFGQHHDAITGTPCDVSYFDLMVGYREALKLSREVLDGSTGFVASAVTPAGDGLSVVVFNSLNWSRGGLVTFTRPDDVEKIEVRTADGDVLPSRVNGNAVEVLVSDIPGMGYAALDVIVTKTTEQAAAEDADSTASGKGPDLSDGAGAESIRLMPTSSGTFGPRDEHAETTIENEFWTITLNPAKGGGITGLVDRETGRELIDGTVGVGNDLIAMIIGDNPWEFITNGERTCASDFPAKITVEETPVGITATITGTLGQMCSYTRTLSLRPGCRTVDARVEVNGYAKDDHQFVVTMPVALAGAQPVFEDRYGTVVARRGKTKFDYRTSGSRRMSDCAIFPVYNWMEAGWSARVESGDSTLNLGMNGIIVPYNADLEDALMPLHRSLMHLGIGSTHYFDDNDIPRRKKLNLGGYGSLFYGHLSDDSVDNRENDVAMCAQWMAVSVDGNNAYVADLLERMPDVAGCIASQVTENGWGVAITEDDRIPEGWPAIPVIVINAVSADALTDAVTKLSSDLDTGTRIHLPEGCDFRPNAGEVADYGFGVLANGNGSATMEPDGTLTVFLGRTSGFAQDHIERDINPELRDMVFEYAFYGHVGSWRDGGIVKAGYEYANPIPVAMPADSTSELPSAMSFATMESENAVVTTLKPADNPILTFEQRTADPAEKGIIVRAYDASGRGTSGTLTLASDIRKVHTTNLIEEDTGKASVKNDAVDWAFDPFAIETVRVTPGDKLPQVGSGTFAPVAEPFQPVWCRSWLHNAGAHPMGYLPVGIYIDGELPIENRGGQFATMGHVRVWIVNNTDETIRGTARVVVPQNWRTVPGEIEYEIKPKGVQIGDVLVLFDQRPRAGLIKVRMEFDGQTYQDVLEAGYETDAHSRQVEGSTGRWNAWTINKEREPVWDMFREDGDILVRVRNPWLEPLEVEVAIVSPMETWGSDADGYGLCTINPGYVGKTIPGRGEEILRFRVEHDGDIPRFWAWAKLMCHGKPDYRPVPGTTA
jgi:alpha-mannosidase